MIKVTVIFKFASNSITFYSKEHRVEVQSKILDARRRNVSEVVLRASNGSTIFDPRNIAGVLLEEVSD